MSKIKILVAPGDRAGSGKFRCVDPHVKLQNKFPDDYFVDINDNINFEDNDYLKKYDVIFLHRVPQNNFKKSDLIIDNLKKLGLKVIIDTDDYWQVDRSHGMYNEFKRNNTPGIIISALKKADLVTTTSEILAKEIRQFQKNVAVIPNAIDPAEEQFIPKPTKSDMIRFGWLGGSTHQNDIEKLRDFAAMQNTIPAKTQIVLCGFDTRGTINVFNKATQQMESRPMKPEETSWFIYECLLTNNYLNLGNDENYLKYLMTFNDDSSYNSLDKVYRRIWTKGISQYATGYNQFDVSIVPLNDNIFNSYKSNLKVIEAGFHKKALIIQDYGPYKTDLISAIEPGGGFNPKGNCLLVDVKKNHKQWFKYAKKLTENPELIKELGERLYETVKEKYNLDNVTEYRNEVYKNLIK
jgi:glycosyltransferase involved in cell wall biosynthesis